MDKAESTPLAESQTRDSPAQTLDQLGGGPHFMMSLARGLLVLGAFNARRPHLTIAQGSRITGLARATVKRCFYTLERLGYLHSNEGRFTLRPKILLLAQGYYPSSIATVAQPVLNQLSEDINESCSLGVLDEGNLIILARGESRRIVTIALKPGSRLPAYCSSMGRVLLAHLSEHELNASLRKQDFRKRTEHTVVAEQGLMDIFARIRRTGYTLVDQELELGLRSVAVPIFNREGEVIAAMSAGLQVSRTSLREARKRIAPALSRASAEISRLI